MTVLGIDLSKWDGIWDAEKAKAAGAAFAFIKASQATFTDPLFSTHWSKGKAAGLLRGAYHYLDYTKPARDQASYFAALLKVSPGELPPVVDFEQRRTDNNPAVARAFLRDFLAQMSSFGFTPIIYTSNGFWSEYGDKADPTWAKYPLWIAQYTTAPAPTVPLPWTRWTFWQYTSKGSGPSYGTESLSLDLNHFNGSLNELRMFAGLAASDPVTPPTVPAPGPLTLEERVALLEQRAAALEQKLSTGTPLPPSPPLPPPAPASLYAVCAAAGLNLRRGPGVSYPVVGGLVYGQRVKVLERQSGWAQSESPAGWCSEKYVNFVSA
jgi:lysozyme